MTFTLLVRISGDGDDPVYVRSYGTHQAAMHAKELAEHYLISPHAPTPPGAAPEGFAQTVGAIGTGYRAMGYRPSDDPMALWHTEDESRERYPLAWDLYDARKDAHYWWLQANPIDRGAPPGSLYTLQTVEHVNA